MAWNQDPESNLGRVLAARAAGMAEVDQRADDLMDEADPRTTFELLQEWERECGLPDRCVGDLSTLQERRAAVVSILTATGGQSAAYFEALAADLGYQVTVSEFRPFRAGRGRAGEPAYGTDWAHAWQVDCGATAITSFRAGQSGAGERLRTWGNERLECAITARQPAHTHVIFTYDA
jgi:uncharacterized protein YmfQ (DUF2313 family)